jgi:phospholipid/cholesterol/gamma-HCH transport system substrate-binding protein
MNDRERAKRGASGIRKRLSVVLSAVALAASVACGSNGGHTYVVEFIDVGDLVGRANVQQSDAVVGTVRAIDLAQRGDRDIARVTIAVEQDTKVTRGTTAVVRSTSLLGEKYVDLVPGTDDAPVPDGGTIPVTRTSKAPELEAVFAQLGALLQSGGLEDLARITTASAAILEGQGETIGRVLDGSAKLLASIRSQKDALASGLADLSEASKTLRGRTDTLAHALDVSDDALRVVAAQSGQLSDLITQLDKLGAPLAALTREHSHDIDAQVKAINKVVPKLYEVRATLEHAVRELPEFTELFARAAPGDYVQLDVFAEAVPIGDPALATGLTLQRMLLEATL